MSHIDRSEYKSTNDEIWIPEGYQPTKDDLNRCKQIKEYMQDFRNGSPTNVFVGKFINDLDFRLKIWLNLKNDNIIQIIDKNVFEPIQYKYNITIPMLDCMIMSMDRVIVKLKVMLKKRLTDRLNEAYSLKYIDQNDLKALQGYKELTESRCKESTYVDTDTGSSEAYSLKYIDQKPLQIICISAEDSKLLDGMIHTFDMILIVQDLVIPLDKIVDGMMELPFESNDLKCNYVMPILNKINPKISSHISYRMIFDVVVSLKELRKKWIVVKDPKLQKGTDTVMGVNIKDNTSEGKSFENAFKFDKKDKEFDEQIKKPVESNGEWQSYIDNQIVPTCKPDPSKRISKTEYYLNIAKTVASRGTCLRRKFGAIIVKNDRIVSTGYVGAPRGRKNCSDIGKCFRMENNIPSGTRYEACRSCHAEMNAIIFASPEEMENATMYLCGIENDGSITPNANCCSMCKRLIINAGIKNVVIAKPNGNEDIPVQYWVDNDDSLELHDGKY